MSKLEGEPPKIIGAPGRAIWARHKPARFSTTCWTSVPVIVAGEVAPVIPMEINSEGIPARAQSMRLCEVSWLQRSGGEGQASKMARGLARKPSAPPRMAASISRIGPNPATRNVPVTTGLALKSRAR